MLNQLFWKARVRLIIPTLTFSLIELLKNQYITVQNQDFKL